MSICVGLKVYVATVMEKMVGLKAVVHHALYDNVGKKWVDETPEDDETHILLIPHATMFSAAQHSFMDGVDPASLRLGSIVVDLFSCGIPYADMVMEMDMREKLLSKGVHHSEDI